MTNKYYFSCRDKWHKCHVCNYYLQTESALSLHKGKHDETCAKKLVCEFCQTRFHYWKTYALHANKSHADNVAAEWRFCDKCGLYFPPSEHRHFKDPEKVKEISCKFCSETFKLSKDHIHHCNSEHKDDISVKWFFCEHCLDYYPTVKGLNRHQTSFCKSLKGGNRKLKRKQKLELDLDDEDEIKVEPSLSRRPRRSSSKRINYDLDNYQVN
jgi:uncharacterized C2H2 Zn-finger protein